MPSQGSEELNFTVSGVLSADEQAKVQKAAREAVLKEQHDKLFKQALEDEKRRLRLEAGLIEADPDPVEEEMVWVDIKLPDSITPVGALITNGRCFWHGQTYRVPVSVAIDLASRQGMAWTQDDRIHGRFVDTARPKPLAYNGVTGGVTGSMPVPVGR